jgi:plasmid maintenance system antidote protein VapI
MARTIEPTHPGQMLKEDFLNEMGIRPSTIRPVVKVETLSCRRRPASRKWQKR